jgi:hypothetical protein
VVVARTVLARAESVRIPSLLRDLLAKSAGLTRESVCNGSRPLPSLYMKGYDRLEKTTIDQSINIHLVLYVLP